jgi:hypothetical protein
VRSALAVLDRHGEGVRSVFVVFVAGGSGERS